MYIDPSCFDEDATKTLINLARKELIEDMYRQATGQSIIDENLENLD